MAILFQCSSCNSKMRVPDAHAGKKAKCPSCKQVVNIPAQSTLKDATKSTLDLQATEDDLALQDPNAPAGAPEAAKPKFITFDCPSCGKKTGFPSEKAGQPATCPSCKATLMVPDAAGGEAFIIGELPPGAPAPAKQGSARSGMAPKVQVRRDLLAKKSNAAAPAVKRTQALVVLGGVLAAGLVTGLLLMWALNGGNAENTAANTPASGNNAPAVNGSATNDATPAALGQSDHASEPSGKTGAAVTPRPDEIGGNPAATPKETKNGPSDEPLLISRQPRTEESTAPITPQPAEETPATQAATETPATPATKTDEDDLDLDKLQKENADKEKPPEVAQENPEGEKTSLGFLKKDDPAKAEDPAAQPAQPAQPANPEPEKPKEPDPELYANKFAPLPTLRPLVHLGDAPPAQDWVLVPWQYSPTYKGDKDNEKLITDAKLRFMEARKRYLAWVEMTKLKLLMVNTHHVTLYCELPETLARSVGDACEKLTAHLQKVTKSVALTPALPAQQEIMIFWEDFSYQNFINVLAQKNPGVDYTLARAASGSSDSRHFGFFNSKKAAGAPPEHMTLHQFGKFMIMEATDGKAPPWLAEGFASYSENAVLNKNLVYSFRYEMNDVKFSPNWNEDLRKLAEQRKLKEWKFIFQLDLIGMGSLDYFTCYSMVSFFMKSDPQRFVTFVQYLRDGMEQNAALTKAFGRPVEDLQKMWGQWALRQR
ncbi:MAG: hypothetical protein L6R28_04520 [Planctomycetes bacterium]|nr:hypothetical protein [Planctomycetota bacterium]